MRNIAKGVGIIKVFKLKVISLFMAQMTVNITFLMDRCARNFFFIEE